MKNANHKGDVIKSLFQLKIQNPKRFSLRQGKASHFHIGESGTVKCEVFLLDCLNDQLMMKVAKNVKTPKDLIIFSEKLDLSLNSVEGVHFR